MRVMLRPDIDLKYQIISDRKHLDKLKQNSLKLWFRMDLFWLWMVWISFVYNDSTNLTSQSWNVFYTCFWFKLFLPPKIVFRWKSSSIEIRLSSKVVLRGCVPWKVVFHQRLSSIKSCLPSKVVFHQFLILISNIRGNLQKKQQYI